MDYKIKARVLEMANMILENNTTVRVLLKELDILNRRYIRI